MSKALTESATEAQALSGADARPVDEKPARYRRSPISIAVELLPVFLMLGFSYLVWQLFFVAALTATPHWFQYARLLLVAEFLRRYFNSVYSFRQEFIRSHEGLLSLRYRKSSIKIRDIREIRTTQTLLGRFLGYGTVELGTASSGAREVLIRNVTAPHSVAAVIEKMRREHRFSKERESIFGLKD